MHQITACMRRIMNHSNSISKIEMWHRSKLHTKIGNSGIMIADHQSDRNTNRLKKLAQRTLKFRSNPRRSMKKIACDHQFRSMVPRGQLQQPLKITRTITLRHGKTLRSESRRLPQMHIGKNQGRCVR